ncbi:tetratricopeptide repeat protein [Arhodomonas sp. AD133]|uniref:tetratricopeptide repeat protein n=1 Tax=Arhodomonas sp. AD133 TaxID=3415009 RepID=UPI003EB79930
MRQPTATPGDFEAQKDKAWALLGLGRLDEAERAFECLVERHPNKPNAYLGRAEVAMRQKDWTSALERWRAALSRFPGNVRFQVGEARSLWKLGYAREAEILLKRTVVERPDKPIAYFALIDVATGHGNHALAAEMSQSALDRFPNDSRVWLARARALMAMKEYEAALACIAEGKRRLPHSPNLFLAEASLHERLFEYCESIRTLEEAADCWPSDVAIALRLALNYLNVGAYDDARARLERIEPDVDADREEPFARAYLRVLSHNGDIDRIQGCLNHWFRQGKQWPTLYEWQATVCVRRGDYGQARAKLTEFLDIRGDSADVFGAQLRCFTLRERVDGVRRLVEASDYGDFAHAFSGWKADAYQRLRRYRTRQPDHARINPHLDEVAGRIADIAGHFDNDYSDASVCPMQAYETVVKVLQCISVGVPMSLIRIGDGEGNFLDYRREWSEFEASDREEVQKLWWGSVRIGAHEWQRLRGSYLGAVSRADILGVPDFMWRFLITAQEFIRSDTLMPAQRGILNAVDRLGEIEYAADEPADPHGGRCITTAHLHYDLAFWGLYELIFEYCQRCSFITCHNDMEGVMRARYGVEVDRVYQVPAEFRWREMFRRDDERRPSHYPHAFERLCESVEVAYPGEVFFVAAGFLGKIYCDVIKARGGIALDVGSIVDQWVGHDSRGAQWYDEFSGQYTEHFRRIVASDPRMNAGGGTQRRATVAGG